MIQTYLFDITGYSSKNLNLKFK